MADTKEMNSLPEHELTGLSCSMLRSAALFLLLFSAPAFLITLQMRRNDLRRAEHAQLHRQTLKTLASIASLREDDCGRVNRAVSGEEARLMLPAPTGLAVLFSPARDLASVGEAPSPLLQPCGV